MEFSTNPPPNFIFGQAPTTGRSLVLFKKDAVDAGIEALAAMFNTTDVRIADNASIATKSETQSGEVTILPTIGVAIVDSPPTQIVSTSFSVTASEAELAASDNPILAVEPERYVNAFAPGTIDDLKGYLAGYRDGINHLIDRLTQPESMVGPSSDLSVAAFDETELTWGLQVTNVANSSFSGRGIRVAVLDTGLDLNHPDFGGRSGDARSFIFGVPTAQDGNGHGTHCMGTACGPLNPQQGPRYGIAYAAEMYVGKVLNNAGGGTDGDILRGIEWAISNGCQVISMSLGARAFVGQPFSIVFENTARRALAAGTLIIAAAGNDSFRPQIINPVGHPANCPSILAVGALDKSARVASFSNGGLNANGGQVDIAAPGVAVRSSWPLNIAPSSYKLLQGTSMATPHVAGIAALVAEATGLRGEALALRLLQMARRMQLPSRDVGTGLVQAP